MTSFAINLFTIWRNPIKLISQKVEKNEISEWAKSVAAEDEQPVVLQRQPRQFRQIERRVD